MIKHKYFMLYLSYIRVVVVNLHVFSFLTFVIIITCHADLYLVLKHKEINSSINYLKFIEVFVAVFFFLFSIL